MRDRSIDRLFRRYRETRDTQALAELFDRVAPDLARIAAHFTKSTDEIEDAVQTAFLTTIEHPEMADPSRPFFPWMIGVVVNRCRELARKRRRVPDADRLPVREPDDPANRASEVEFQRAVERSVEQLSPSYRSTVRAYLSEGLTAAEIAEREGITKNAASVRLHRGLRALRKILPGGFALGGAAMIQAPALAQVREKVLDEAAGSAIAGVVGAKSSFLLTGFAVAGGMLGLTALLLLLLSKTEPVWKGRGIGIALVETDADKTNQTEATLSGMSDRPAARSDASAALAATESTGEVPFRLSVNDKDTRAPIVGAVISSIVAGSAGPRKVVFARTDEKGNADFLASSDVEDELRVDAQGYVSWRRPKNLAKTSELLEKYGISPKGGLFPVTFQVELGSGAPLSGVVVDDTTGMPISGAAIHLFETGRYQPFAISDRPVGFSDGQGRFKVSGGVPFTPNTGAGILLLAVTADGSDRTGTVQFPMLQTTLEAATDPPVIRCRSSLPARVIVQNESGQPLAGIEVVARPCSSPWRMDWVPGESVRRLRTRYSTQFVERFHAVTDGSGVANFEHLVAGSLFDVSSSPSQEPSWEYDFELVSDSWHGSAIGSNLQPGRVERVELTAQRTRFVRIRGVCVAKDGSGLAGSQVTREGPGEGPSTADEEGRFDLGEFSAQDFPLTIHSMPNKHQASRIQVSLPVLTETDVFLRIEHENAVGLQGHVVDENGVGVVGAGLMLSVEGRRLFTGSSGIDGGFEFERVGSGKRELRVLSQDGRSRVLSVEGGRAPITIELPALNSELGITLELVPPPTDPSLPVPLAVQFVDSSGRSFERGHDTVLNVGRGPRQIYREPGIVRADGVSPGEWICHVDCEGFARASLKMVLEPGSGQTPLRVDLVKPGRILGLLHGGEGEGPVLIHLSRSLFGADESGDEPLREWEYETHDYTFTESSLFFELTPGDWQVTARRNDLSVSETIVVRSGENPPFELRLGAR